VPLATLELAKLINEASPIVTLEPPKLAAWVKSPTKSAPSPTSPPLRVEIEA